MNVIQLRLIKFGDIVSLRDAYREREAAKWNEPMSTRTTVVVRWPRWMTTNTGSVRSDGNRSLWEIKVMGKLGSWGLCDGTRETHSTDYFVGKSVRAIMVLSCSSLKSAPASQSVSEQCARCGRAGPNEKASFSE